MRTERSQRRIESLLDMISVKGDVLLSIGKVLGEMSATPFISQLPFSIEVKVEASRFAFSQPRVVQVTPRQDVSLDQPIQQFTPNVEQWANTMMEDCKALELRESLKQARRIHEGILNAPLPIRAFIDMIRDLCQRIVDELADKIILQVDAERSSLYENACPFGVDVFECFPSANEDITEAATCLALDRGTACVMHLSRVIEVGLRALANALSLPERNDWGKHLEDIEKELTRRYKASGSRSPEELFFSEAAAQIGHMKAAWRNPSMHVDKNYSPQRAEDVFVAVRGFMRHFATKLHECT